MTMLPLMKQKSIKTKSWIQVIQLENKYVSNYKRKNDSEYLNEEKNSTYPNQFEIFGEQKSEQIERKMQKQLYFGINKKEFEELTRNITIINIKINN